jgi:DNA replication protein DnaC
MTTNQTLEKLRQMRLYAMAELHQNHLQNHLYDDLTTDDYLDLLTQHQWEQRQNKRIERLIKQAKFKENASIADIDFNSTRNLDKNMFNRLSTLDFIRRKENLIITGASGTGKSYLTQALGHQACLMGMSVQYYITSRLLDYLKFAKLDGTYFKELKKINKSDILILDDFGLQSFNNKAREALMDIIEDRHNSRSTFVCSQIPVSGWHKLIGEGTIADAILDRIINSAHRIQLKGESMRKINMNKIKN